MFRIVWKEACGRFANSREDSYCCRYGMPIVIYVKGTDYYGRMGFSVIGRPLMILREED
jgi:hypothetical protein